MNERTYENPGGKYYWGSVEGHCLVKEVLNRLVDRTIQAERSFQRGEIKDVVFVLDHSVNESARELGKFPRDRNRTDRQGKDRRKAQVCPLDWCDSPIEASPAKGRVGHFYYESEKPPWNLPVEIEHSFKERRLKDRRAC